VPPVNSVRFQWPYLCPILADGLHLYNRQIITFQTVKEFCNDRGEVSKLISSSRGKK